MNYEQKVIYDRVILLLSQYFNRRDWKKLFLSGGCYWFANYLCSIIPNATLVRNASWEHCAICVAGKIYDITGRIPSDGFHAASDAEVKMMQREYKPNFNMDAACRYLSWKLQIWPQIATTLGF